MVNVVTRLNIQNIEIQGKFKSESLQLNGKIKS